MLLSLWIQRHTQFSLTKLNIRTSSSKLAAKDVKINGSQMMYPTILCSHSTTTLKIWSETTAAIWTEFGLYMHGLQWTIFGLFLLHYYDICHKKGTNFMHNQDKILTSKPQWCSV